MLADLCPCFHRSSTKLCPDLVFRSCAGLRPNFGHSRSKLRLIMSRLRTKFCRNFGCSRARLCLISFAPRPFPNLAGTLYIRTRTVGHNASEKCRCYESKRKPHNRPHCDPNEVARRRDSGWRTSRRRRRRRFQQPIAVTASYNLDPPRDLLVRHPGATTRPIRPSTLSLPDPLAAPCCPLRVATP